MKTTVVFLIWIVSWYFSGQAAHAQCYRCDNDSTSWLNVKESGYKLPTKEFKTRFPDAKNVKWYNCEFGYFFAVEYFGDSSKTYFFSYQKKWLGTETRYRVTVERNFPVGAEPDPALSPWVVCHGPDILPKTLHGLVAEVFGISNLDTLNKVNGMQFWVCDIFRVELPKSHPICTREKTTTLYVVSMDFIFHVYTRDRELFFPNNMTNHGFLYTDVNTIYETDGETPPTLPVED